MPNNNAAANTAHLVILGASGDLTARYLVPALAELWNQGRLNDGFRVLGIARDDWSNVTFREHLARALPPAAGPARVREDFLRGFTYLPADVTDAAQVSRALGATNRPLVAYLAIPPGLFAPAIAALARLPPGTVQRVVVEKPFGDDLASARALNAALHESFPEQTVFRMDHFLGHQTVQNILGLRFGNRLFEPI